MLDNRASFLRSLLHEHRLDALLVTKAENLRYLCGFTGMDGALIVTAQEMIFLTDSRYSTQAAAEVTADQQRQYAQQVEGVIAALEEVSAQRVGFETEELSCAALERLQARSSGKIVWVGLGRPLLVLRGIKDQGEIAALQEAAHRGAEAFDEILPLLRPGISEKEIGLALEFALRRHGGDDKSFELIVASGPRGALPHGAASERCLAENECVTIDFGLRRNGYASDETVTVALGEIDAEMERVYEAVYQAQQRAFAAIRPGVALQAIDAAARDSIARAGYGPFFGHGLGHGVGLEVHEYPTLSPRSQDVAQIGMVFTVEPGIYLPNKGGVRLEDMVVVTADGYQKLTRIPKELRRLP